MECMGAGWVRYGAVPRNLPPGRNQRSHLVNLRQDHHHTVRVFGCENLRPHTIDLEPTPCLGRSSRSMRQEQAYYPDSSARPKFFFCHVDRDKETHTAAPAACFSRTKRSLFLKDRSAWASARVGYVPWSHVPCSLWSERVLVGESERAVHATCQLVRKGQCYDATSTCTAATAPMRRAFTLFTGSSRALRRCP
jgi:hypothetical protein